MDKTLEYQRDEHRVHLIVYHLIWCPRRRKPVLTGTIAERCKQLIEEKCAQKGWTILTLAIEPDHIHLFVRVWPIDSASEVVKEVKGITSFHLRKEFPILLNYHPCGHVVTLPPQQAISVRKPFRNISTLRRECANVPGETSEHRPDRPLG